MIIERPVTRIWLILLVLLGGALAAHAQTGSADRIVVVGDLHGDFAAYQDIVTAAHLANRQGRWTGGKTIFVQMGDIADRGPDSLKIIRALRQLEKQARRAGGRVIVLMGNHEAMNVIGDLRYVHPGEYAAFADSNSQARRERVYEANRKAVEAFYAAAEPPLDAAQARAKWMADYPIGKVEHRFAWSPKGEIGAWVAQLPAVVMLNGTLFVHGGISAEFAGHKLEDLNRMAAQAITQQTQPPAPLLEDPLGPLWYRGNIFRDEAEGKRLGLRIEGGVPLDIGPCEDPCILSGKDDKTGVTARGDPCVPGNQKPFCPVDRMPIEKELDLVLSSFGAKRLVVGHTPSMKGITSLANGRLIMTDTGISAHYKGPRSYLELQGDEVIAWSRRADGTADAAWEKSKLPRPGP